MPQRSDYIYHQGKQVAYFEPLPREWPMFSRGPTRQGYNPDSTVPDTPTQRWTYDTGDFNNRGPVLGDDAVLFGNEANKIYALEQSDGTLRWDYSTTDDAYGVGAFADGVFYIGTDGGIFYAFNTSDGSVKWSIDTGSGNIRGPPVVDDGVVYMNTNNAPEFRALDVSDGSEIWTQTVNQNVNCGLTLASGVIYGGTAGDFYALNAGDGSVKWTRAITWDEGWAAPTVVNGSVYVGESSGDSLYSLNASDGSTEWTFTSTSSGPGYTDFVTSPAVYDGTVYASCRDGYLYAINASDGSKLWDFDTGGSIYSSPAVADSKVVVGTDNYRLYALNISDGSKIWEEDLDSSVTASPAIKDGTVYILSNTYNPDGVYAIE